MMASDTSGLCGILDGFKGKGALVIGDLMLDKYVFGNVSRISPEAPVQVVDIESEKYVPGGAANVANNVAVLGGRAFIVGLIGADEPGERLVNELKKRNIGVEGAFVDMNRPTIQKIRVLGRNQQILRIDYEDTKPIEKDLEIKIRSYIAKVLKTVNVVIVSDYAKGLVTPDLMKDLVRLCKENGKILLIDPKPQHKPFYAGADIITPNTKEASEMSGIPGKSDADVMIMGKKLCEELGATVLITRGEKGMTLFQKNGEVTHLPTKAREVYDVSGAGDTVVATIALALSSGAKLTDAAVLANHAGGIKVGKLGTAPVSVDEMKKVIGT